MAHDTPSRRPPAPFEPTSELPLPVSSDAARDAFLFEVAWEVCNQVGGIYQVIRSKAPLMTERHPGRYCLIGPYVEAKARLEMEEATPPGWLGRLVQALAHKGLNVHFGRWLVTGSPFVLLVDLEELKT